MPRDIDNAEITYDGLDGLEPQENPYAVSLFSSDKFLEIH